MKLRDLGVTQKKEDYPVAVSDSEKKNEKRYPELNLHGSLADKMGAGDCKVGQRFEQTILWEVKSVSKTQTDGEDPVYSLTLCAVKGSDMESAGGDDDSYDESKDTGDGDDDESDGESTPALSYIENLRKK